MMVIPRSHLSSAVPQPGRVPDDVLEALMFADMWSKMPTRNGRLGVTRMAGKDRELSEGLVFLFGSHL